MTLRGRGWKVLCSSRQIVAEVAWHAKGPTISHNFDLQFIFDLNFAMCWDEYAQFEKAIFEEREQSNREQRYVLANRVRMTANQRASVLLLRERTAAALPPLAPEPYELRTTFPSNHTTLREHLLLPYYAVLCSILFFTTPIWFPVSVAIACLEKVGLWSYIKRPFQHLVLSPILSAARAVLRPLRYSYGLVVGLSRKCTRPAIRTRIRHYIVKLRSLTVALLLLPSRTFFILVHRTTKLASVLLSPDSYPVECKKASCSCLLRHLRDAINGMAGFGKKLFYGIVTLVLGFFAVLPLTIYAVITFWLAVGWLSLMILVKGAGVIQRSLKHWWKGDDRNSPEAIAERNRAAAVAKREARSRSESFSQSSASTHSRSQSNRSNRSGSSVSLVSLPYNPPQIDRDYEGT